MMVRRNATVGAVFSTAVVLLVMVTSQEARTEGAQHPVSRERRATASSKGIPPDPVTRLAEVPNDPPAPLSVLSQRGVSPGMIVTRGPFVSVQVNIDAMGNNIVGDAANEPSIAIDPTDSSKMAIAWRQFDTIASDFRQAGHAYSQDGGQTWTFPGVLDPGQFRSDPVLGADPDGNFFFSSLSALDSIEVFKSIDGGVTWLPPVPAFGGDKQWIAVDRTSGIGRGNVYQIWNVLFTCCPPNDFTRSTNGGASFESPIALPLPSMKWGTMDVAPDGRLYLAGSTLDLSSHLVARSTNAQDPSPTPTFDFVQSVSLGGSTTFGGPNPAGLAGQVWIATDHSDGPTQGNVYILGSVNPPGADPLDVMFIRSTDDGNTWSAPVRVNDDPTGNGAYQWFGTMSVAPSGRIDVVWNDTRTSGATNLSELFYASSTDGGVTWSPNIVLTPVFDSFVGWPRQNKIGDYYHMISDDGGASLAYAATFNGEQDVYFLRISVDCNDNGIEDSTDIADGTSDDCNGNQVPDECEPDEDCNNNSVQDICDIADGFSDDCNNNQVPDECEPSEDCNDNGTADICDIGNGTSLDCNENGVPDECDIASGTSPDDNGDGIPDECQGACCVCDGCFDTTLADCAAQGGSFMELGTLCKDVTCLTLENDNCSDKEVLPTLLGQTVTRTVAFDNRCATNDGPPTVPCDNGTQPFGADIWYSFVAPCSSDMLVSLCDQTGFDAILAVYGGGPSCTCPFDNSSLITCSDDSCGVGGGPPTVWVKVNEGACYTIRVAGWSGATGIGEMQVSVFCDCPLASPPRPDPLGDKNRYLSFLAGDPGRKEAVRVTFTDLPPPFDGLNGTTMWVGEPQDVSENGSSVEPIVGFPNFKAATLECEPFFMDWSELGTVHVFHENIVPNGVYDIEVLDEKCPIEAEIDYSDPLTLTMARWGDTLGDCQLIPCSPPDGVVNIIDVTGILGRFISDPNSITKARADLEPACLDLLINISDVLFAIAGFQGLLYPFTPSDPIDPCLSTCFNPLP